MRVLLTAFALLLLIPSASGAFYDATPAWPTPVVDIATDDGRIIGGHGNGLIVALARSDGHILWSRQPFTSSVTGLALHEGFAFASFADPPTLIAFHVTTGHEAWRSTPASAPTALAADADHVYVGYADGTMTALQHSGDLAWTQVLGARVRALAPESSDTGRIAFVTAANSGWFDATAIMPGGPAGIAVAWHAGQVFVAHGTSVTRHDNAMLETASRDFTYLPTALGSGSHLVMGDTAGLVHVLDVDLNDRQAPIATYAADVTALEVDDGIALAGFQSGWLATLPLDTRPVGLILWPQEQRILPRTIVAKWAYSDPDAVAGDTLDYLLSMRVAADPPVAWQEVSAGTLPVAPLTKLKEVHVDVTGFPDGAPMEVKLELTDKQGLKGFDTLGQPFRLDLEPPSPRAGTSPSEGGVVTAQRPQIGVGHFDRGSGLNEGATQAWIDGNSDVSLKASALASIFSPRFDLADGPHTWRLRVEDHAGNWRTMNGTFVVDLAAPSITTTAIDSRGRETLALSWSTDEPTTCQAVTKPGGTQLESPRGIHHSALLTGLDSDTAYQVEIQCKDGAKRTVDGVIEARTLPREADAPQPVLTIRADPAFANGDNGWFTQIPSFTATTDIPAQVLWSVDGSAYTQQPPALEAGKHMVRAFAIHESGEASTPWMMDVQIDVSAPGAPDITWSDQLRVLRWDGIDDQESGIDRYVVEARSQGDWVIAGTVAWPGTRFEDVPAGATEVRLTVVNGAGLSWTSDAFVVGTTEDRTFSTASVPAPVIDYDGRVRVRYHLVIQEQFQTAFLRDQYGVERPFADKIRLEGRLFEASAPASAFPSGTHTAVVRVTEGVQQRELVAGTITINERMPHADLQEQRGDPDIVHRRESPFPFVLPVLGLIVWLRRRS